MLCGYVFNMVLLFVDVIWFEYDVYYCEMHDYMVINHVFMMSVVVIIGG